MKNRFLTLLITTALLFAVTGCGKSNTASAETEKKTATETDEVSDNAEANEVDQTSSNDANTIEIPSDEPIYSYFTIQTVDNEYDNYEYGIQYSLYDGDPATLVEEYTYSPNYTAQYMYRGSYIVSDDNVTFVHDAATPADSSYAIAFLLENGIISSVEYGYSGSVFCELAGTYSCESDELGKLNLTITTIGKAKLDAAGTIYNGSIYYTADQKYNVTVYSDDDDSNYFDWYIDFDGDKFTYSNFYVEADYEDISGTYNCYGELGSIDINIDKNGTAVTNVTIDGIDMVFTGYIYCDTDLRLLTGGYLSSEEGYSLDLSLVYLEDEGFWNYSGTLSRPLSAG